MPAGIALQAAGSPRFRRIRGCAATGRRLTPAVGIGGGPKVIHPPGLHVATAVVAHHIGARGRRNRCQGLGLIEDNPVLGSAVAAWPGTALADGRGASIAKKVLVMAIADRRGDSPRSVAPAFTYP